ncbi:MAG: hypothetical protein ISS56_08405 [Anaerolineae bacterium]|nr:hypothetical protein [Anaerolineae bacterium]
MALTIAAVAENKGIAPERIDVQIERESIERTPWRTFFSVQIDLGEGLTRRDRTILFNSARRCEVYKLLNGEMTFDYRLIDRSQGSQA